MSVAQNQPQVDPDLGGPLPPGGILDLHCHVAGFGAGNSGCFVSEGLRRSYKFDVYLASFGVKRKEVEAHGDGLIIQRLSEKLARSRWVSRAVVLAMDGALDAAGALDRKMTEFYIPDAFVAGQAARYSNLLFGASINPLRQDALERLAWAKAHGACLVKWLPSIQRFDPADERLVPFYRKLVELGLPLLSHTGQERSFTQACDEYADPDRLRLALGEKVTVIAAHAASLGVYAGERSIDRLARLMGEFPKNIWADISALTQINRRGCLREVLRRPEFRGRLLYGTDYPLINTLLVSPWYFLSSLGLGPMLAISRLENPWDRDVALKQALGVPADAWTRAETVLSQASPVISCPNAADRPNR